MEIEFRQKVASAINYNPLEKITLHHSIPVMDFEVARFLIQIPHNGRVIDVRGCWGWHWRKLAIERPDLRVFIIDFIRSNLLHAESLLGDHLSISYMVMRPI